MITRQILKGGASQRERQHISEEMSSIPEDEERLIIATGRYLGEGFDDARLDTLFLALPVSWRGTLSQYAGRLHRLHDMKKEVVIYDYVDLTYMGVLKPMAGNANYSTSGHLSPLFNGPYYNTIGMGTRIFLGGAQGYVIGPGTQHNPHVERGGNGVPLRQSGTLMVMGNLKEMNPRYLIGVSILGYGCSLAVGLGIPIPILNEQIARHTGVSDEEIFTQILDYGNDYPQGKAITLGQVSYADLKSGTIQLNGHEVPTAPISSYTRALEIAHTLKEWIEKGAFLLTEPQELLPR
jgi:uncharacterized protein (DUF39 family)